LTVWADIAAVTGLTGVVPIVVGKCDGHVAAATAAAATSGDVVNNRLFGKSTTPFLDVRPGDLLQQTLAVDLLRRNRAFPYVCRLARR
jgi:hypothetical protein